MKTLVKYALNALALVGGVAIYREYKLKKEIADIDKQHVEMNETGSASQ